MAKKERRTGDPMIPLIRVARQQIEATAGGPLGWLIRFVREDPARWLPGDVEAHGHRLLALVYGPLPANLVRFGSADIPPVTPGDVEEIHAELLDFFRQLVRGPAGAAVKVPTDDLQQVLVRATASEKKPAIFVSGPGGGPRRTVLFQTVRDLVLKDGDRLIACPTCKEPFFALGKRLFCSQKCLQRWYDARRPSRKKGAA